MRKRSWIAWMRRQRLAVGLVVAYALVFAPLVSAVAQPADPLQALVDGHVCGPGGKSNDSSTPAAPTQQNHDCQLCGPSCPMGGAVPVGGLAAALVSVAPFIGLAERSVRPDSVARAPLSRYPSDALSQAPPSMV
jgi:hypothetical protein